MHNMIDDDKDPLIWISERAHILRPVMRPGNLATLYPLALVRPVGPFLATEDIAFACGVHSSTLCQALGVAQSLGIITRDDEGFDWCPPSEWHIGDPHEVEEVAPTAVGSVRDIIAVCRKRQVRPLSTVVAVALLDGPMNIREIGALCNL